MDIGRELRVIEVVEETDAPVEIPVPEEPVSFEATRPAPLAE